MPVRVSPLPSTLLLHPANVCSFHGNLDGDTICSAYSFVIEEAKVYVWRPPCLADDLEVNGGIWRGETTELGYDTFPNGWGVLQYAETDHLSRCLGCGGWNP